MPVVTIACTGIGYLNQWTLTGAADKMAAVATADSGTSHISEATNSDVQAFTMEDLPGQASRINSVKVSHQSRATPAIDTVAVGVRLNATNVSANLALTTSFASYTSASLARPGGGTWTVPDVNSMEVFVGAVLSGANTLQVSYLVGTIDIEYAGGGFALLVSGLAGACAWLDLPQMLAYLARRGVRLRRDELPALLDALGAPRGAQALWMGAGLHTLPVV